MIQFYKFNSKTSGGACSFYLNKTDGSFFGTIVKQASWDDKRKKGSVDKESQITVKYSPQEISDFIYAVEQRGTFSAYHSSPKSVTKVNFAFSETGDKSGFHYNVVQEPKEDSTQKNSIRLSTLKSTSNISSTNTSRLKTLSTKLGS